MDAPTQIIINIGPDSPKKAIKAIAALLEAAGDSVEVVHTAIGVPVGQVSPLNEKWLTEDLIYECADATGISRNQGTRAVTGFVKCVRARKFADESGNNDTLPRVLANAQLVGVEGQRSSINAADYVQLVRSEEVQRAIRERVSSYGPEAQAASYKLADYLEKTYGQPTA